MLWQSSGKMSTAIRLLTRCELCSHVKASFNCPISFLCSKSGENISLHLFVPVLSYLSLHRENVSGECGRSGCNRLLVRSRPDKYETIQVKLETIQACAKMRAHVNPVDTKNEFDKRGDRRTCH